MHFCLTGQYTPQAVASLIENPTTNRFEAAKKSLEAAGGKIIAMYGVPAEGPGVMVIFEVTDPAVAAAISAVVIAAGTLHKVKVTRLLTHEEVVHVRQIAKKARDAYAGPGK